jgi:hypothetical protein
MQPLVTIVTNHVISLTAQAILPDFLAVDAEWAMGAMKSKGVVYILILGSKDIELDQLVSK